MTSARNWFPSDDFTIVVDVDRILIEDGDARLEFEPTVHVTPSREGARGGVRLISAVYGERPRDDDRGIPVRMFYADDLPSDILSNKHEYLARLLRHALNDLMGRYRFPLKPRVRLFIAPDVIRATGGYAELLLRRALLQAGAKEVELLELAPDSVLRTRAG